MSTRPTNVEAIYPLSNMQQGMLFHALLEPEAGLYFEQYSFQCNPQLDVTLLRQAWELVVERHAILRTLFVWEKRKQPLQVVRRTVSLPWQELDWRNLPEAEKQTSLEHFLAEDRRKGVDLTKAPLMRFAVLRLSDTDLRLVWSRHHLLLDGWSVAIVLNDLNDFYTQLIAGKAASIKAKAAPPLFQDYIAWLQQQDANAAEKFWRDYLAGFSEATPLPSDRPTSRKDEYYVEKEIWLSEEATDQLRQLARTYRLTINTIVQAAWALLLHRYSGKDEILFGATVAGRPYELAGVSEMVGVFINTLPVRMSIRPDLPVIEWVQLLQRAQLDRDRYEYSLLSDIHKWSELPASATNGLFESILIFENLPDIQADQLLQLEGLSGYERSNYPLTVVGLPGRQLGLRLAYDGRFSHSLIERMLTHFKNLTLEIARQPQLPIKQLNMLSPTEEQQLLRDWQGPAQDYPAILCAHQLFEEQAARYPDTLAVVSPAGQLSYAELNAQANSLAHYLINQAVQPGAKVGICTERTPAMLVGLLAVLKAGAAYVPLNPAYPLDRQSWMLADAGAEILLTEQALAEQGKVPDSGFKIVYMDGAESPIYAGNVTNPELTLAQDYPSHVIYTSGSTGQPRGVISSHRALVNLGLSFLEAHGFDQTFAGQRWLMIPHISFSASIGDLFPAFFNAMTIVLHPDPAALTGTRLVEFCNEYAINIINTAVPLWKQWTETLPAKVEFASLHTLMVGGDSAPLPVLQRWATATQHRLAFFNHYGQTEVNSCCSAYRTVDGTELQEFFLTNVPIGRPVPNIQVWVLDDALRPVPAGVTGDLYTSGPTLAGGYLNRPELDIAQFIDVAILDSPPRRLYKTGDVGRYLPDGRLEFLGRSDQQVKIRGYRVEPGEIENALKQHPQVHECVILARQEANTSEKYLVAYFVAGKSLEISHLRRFLATRLPEYMIPAYFVELAELPLNANGKVDRQALPAPQPAAVQLNTELVPLTTETEKQLAAIWQETLVTPGKPFEVGAYTNFFEAGGHSLKAALVMTRLNEVFSLNLPLRTIFELPELRALARYIEASQKGEVAENISPGVDLRAEAFFKLEISPDIVAPVDNPVKILLTGATGFLGSYLLAELLQQTSAKIYCFVRAETPAAGFKRIQQTLQNYRLWDDNFIERIVPIAGDLAEVRLGLDEATYEKLAQEIELIVHNGGTVNFLQSYSALKPANVEGTKEVVRLATTYRLKPVHFVSTLSIFLAKGYLNQVITEQTNPLLTQGLAESYTESKWVADTIIRQAGLAGLPVTVYRPARITGASQTGITNLGDLLCRYWKGCIQLGALPLNASFDLIPVDFLAKTLVSLLRQTNIRGKVLHFYNQDRLNAATLANILNDYNCPVQLLPYNEWYTRLSQSESENSLHTLLPLLARSEQEIEPEPVFDCSLTSSLLPASYPTANAELVGKYLNYFAETDFVPGLQLIPGIV